MCACVTPRLGDVAQGTVVQGGRLQMQAEGTAEPLWISGGVLMLGTRTYAGPVTLAGERSRPTLFCPAIAAYCRKC